VGPLYGETLVVLSLFGVAALASDGRAQRRWLLAAIAEKTLSASIGVYYGVGGGSYVATNVVFGLVLAAVFAFTPKPTDR